MWSSWSPMTIPESWHFFSFSFKNASSHKSHDLCLASHTTYCCYLHTSSLSTTHHSIWHAFQCFFLSQLPPIVLGNFVIKMDGPVEFLTLNILNSPLVPTTKQTHNECVVFFFSHNDLPFHFASLPSPWYLTLLSGSTRWTSLLQAPHFFTDNDTCSSMSSKAPYPPHSSSTAVSLLC